MGLAKTCTPCRGGIPPLPPGEADRYLAEAPGWHLSNASTRIERRFEFKNFAEAIDFANKIGSIADQEGHHPDICLGWGYCAVVFYTRMIRGLHGNDFILAAKVNALV